SRHGLNFHRIPAEHRVPPRKELACGSVRGLPACLRGRASDSYQTKAHSPAFASPDCERTHSGRHADRPLPIIWAERNSITSDYVETFCSDSTTFRTVGRCIMRSRHAV